MWATQIVAGLPDLPVYHRFPFTLLALWHFLRAFTRTLFRGELFWKAKYFDLFSEGMNDVFLTWVPLFFVGVGLAAAMKAVKIPGDTLRRFFALSGLAVVLVLMYGQFALGNIAYYHARLAMGSFYFLMFPLCLGALKIFRSEKFTYALLFLGLILYNIFYSLLLLIRVL